MARIARPGAARKKDRGSRPLMAAVAVDSLGTGLYLPLSLLYFLKATDRSLPTIGVLVSVAAALTLPLPLAVGRIVDRIGPRAVVAGGQALQGAGFLLYLTVSGTVSVLAAAVVMTGGVRVYWSSVFTLIADQADATGTEAKDHLFARIGMVRETGAGGGALLAGALLAVDSARLDHRLPQDRPTPTAPETAQ